MKVINHGGKDYQLEFTYNSFRWMEDFDVRMFGEIQSKPFKIIPLTEIMLVGALNNNPSKPVSSNVAIAIVEEKMSEGTIGELFVDLQTMLTESNFFKTLQAKQSSQETLTE